MADTVESILEKRRRETAAAAQAEQPARAEPEGDKFFSLLNSDVLDDPLLELRFQDGFKLCLPYRDVVWLSYDPKGPNIKIDFGSTIIRIEGRGLDGELFEGLKNKRVLWITEPSSEMQDNDKNKVFIKEIGFEAEEQE